MEEWRSRSATGGGSRTTRRLLHSGLLLGLAALLSGCSTAGFYAQAVGGQLELTRKAKPIERVIADPATPDSVRSKLHTVEEICRFARDQLELETGRSYTRYADLGRDHVVWSVFAAPEFSLRPKTWKFPLIGKLSYRGFFSEAAAGASATELRDEGYDVHVGGVGAYSTLGVFADPALNTFIDRPDTALAELIFHELAHRRLYRRGQTSFNESFANAVAQEGVRRWLRSRGNRRAVVAYEKRLKRRAELVQEFARTRKTLKELYASGQPEAVMASKKKSAFDALQSKIRTLFQNWDLKVTEEYLTKIDNNARMNATATYHDLIPFFLKLLAENGGDLEAFYQAAEESHPPT